MKSLRFLDLTSTSIAFSNTMVLIYNVEGSTGSPRHISQQMLIWSSCKVKSLSYVLVLKQDAASNIYFGSCAELSLQPGSVYTYGEKLHIWPISDECIFSFGLCKGIIVPYSNLAVTKRLQDPQWSNFCCHQEPVLLISPKTINACVRLNSYLISMTSSLEFGWLVVGWLVNSLKWPRCYNASE